MARLHKEPGLCVCRLPQLAASFITSPRFYLHRSRVRDNSRYPVTALASGKNRGVLNGND
jgi:hypothetical protein